MSLFRTRVISSNLLKCGLRSRTGRNSKLTTANSCVHGIRSLSSSYVTSYETLNVSYSDPYVVQVELNRPDKRNALNKTLWREIGECFNELSEDKNCRVIVLSGAGKAFTAGIDLGDLAMFAELIQSDEDVARKSITMRKTIQQYQASLTSLEKCRKPVIACIHSACVGAGSNMICSADIRYCTSDAYFQIKEVDLGIAADVGALQRMPRIVGSESLVRELAFTARKMHSDEASKCGLVSRVFKDKDSMIQAALDISKRIASKSPVAVQGTKIHLNYSRDHTIDEGLDYQAVWNMTMLQSHDTMKAAMAQMNKSKAEFSDF